MAVRVGQCLEGRNRAGRKKRVAAVGQGPEQEAR